MKQKHVKKLSLQKKAVSNLSSGEMRQVNGGKGIIIPTIPTVLCWFSVTVTCNPITLGCNPITIACTVTVP
jgi:hypothetical protein